jgi:hypothetical protein
MLTPCAGPHDVQLGAQGIPTTAGVLDLMALDGALHTGCSVAVYSTNAMRRFP